MYQAYLLLKSNTDFTLPEAQRRLAAAFPEATFAAGPGTLALETDDWSIGLQMNAGPDVLVESQQIAEQVTGGEDDQGIGTCDQRVEIASDVPDPEMEYFEKYQRVLEALRSFQGVIPVDPHEPCVL